MARSETSRRQFIAGLAGLGAGALLPQNTGPRRIIDVHHHILPPKFIAQYRKEIGEMGPGINQVFEARA